MKKEDKIIIENELFKKVNLTAEADYTEDRMGNIIFKDRRKVVKEIKELLFQQSKELGIPQKEIQEYLIKIYQTKNENPIFIKERTEIILILNEIGNNDKKENNRELYDKENEIS